MTSKSNLALIRTIYRSLCRSVNSYTPLFSKHGTNAKIFPSLSTLIGPSFEADPKKLRLFLRTSFKKHKQERNQTNIEKQIDNAFNALRIISNETHTLSQMAQSPSSHATTKDVVNISFFEFEFEKSIF